MPYCIRNLCIGLCVALLAAMNLHGFSQSQHALGHTVAWPSGSMTVAAGDPLTAHVHGAPDERPDPGIERNADDAAPVGHHHHAGGDVQAALPALDRSLTEPSSTAALQWPGFDPALAGLGRDGPEHPPKRMRSVV